MKTTALHQNVYSVYQPFKTYKELDQINMYNIALVTFGVCRKTNVIYPRSRVPNSLRGTSLLKPPIHLKACGN